MGFSGWLPVSASSAFSAMPKTVRPMFAQYCVPAHIAHGSTVVTSVQGQSSAGE